MTGLDFPRPYIIGDSSSLSRHGPPASSAGGQTWDPRALDFGGYMIIDAATNHIVAGATPNAFNLTLDDVEKYLESSHSKRRMLNRRP
jgi:hypothetical protein